jgi:hypothetical protein
MAEVLERSPDRLLRLEQTAGSALHALAAWQASMTLGLKISPKGSTLWDAANGRVRLEQVA